MDNVKIRVLQCCIHIAHLINGVVGTEVLDTLGNPVVDQNILHVVPKLGYQVKHAVLFDCRDDLVRQEYIL